MVYAAPCSLSRLGISTLPAPKGWHSHRGGGSPQQASVPHSRPWRSQQLTRRRAEGALCPVGPTWPVGPVATRAAQKQPAPGRGWAGERPGSPCRAHRAGPSPAAAVLSVFQFRGLMESAFIPAGIMIVSVTFPSSQSKLTTVPVSVSPDAGTI